MTSSPLAIYLNDHLAGATAGLELARRAERQLDDVERHRLAMGLMSLASDA